MKKRSGPVSHLRIVIVNALVSTPTSASFAFHPVATIAMAGASEGITASSSPLPPNRMRSSTRGACIRGGGDSVDGGRGGRARVAARVAARVEAARHGRVEDGSAVVNFCRRAGPAAVVLLATFARTLSKGGGASPCTRRAGCGSCVLVAVLRDDDDGSCPSRTYDRSVNAQPMKHRAAICDRAPSICGILITTTEKTIQKTTTFVLRLLTNRSCTAATHS